MARTEQQQYKLMSVVVAVLAVVCFASAASVNAFTTMAPPPSSSYRANAASVMRHMAVVDVDSEAAFDKTVQGAGDSLVVIDYSTTW